VPTVANGSRGRSGGGNYGRSVRVARAKKKPGRPRKVPRALTSAPFGRPPAPQQVATPEPEEVEGDDVDDVTPEEEERANEARESEIE